ncbi:MAG: transcriptional regulator, AraC family [Paenibacillaceae bacterium]|jgi:AraC-like DNA-binding protein|nr:transcriptional regulator, AraC family [Paenibacillaceae bacterium]
MRRTWFQRLLLSYLPVLILIVCLFVFIGIVQLNDLSRKEAVKSGKVYVDNLMSSVDMSLHAADMMMVETIARNNSLISFAGMESSPVFMIEISRLLQSMTATSSFIDSAYLYRDADGTVVSDGTKLSIDQFADRNYIRESLASNAQGVWSNPRKYRIQESLNEAETVISIFRGIPLQGKSSAILVVNVNLEAVMDFLKKYGNSEVNHISVWDRTGAPLFQQASSTIQTDDVNLVSAYSGWTYRSGLKTAGLGNMLSYMTSGWFLFGFLGLLTGIGWIIYITRKNYKPIETMMSRIEKYNEQHRENPIQGPQADELSYIDYTLNSMMEVTEDYEHRNKVNREYRRLQLFKELVEDSGPADMAEWETELQSMGLETLGSASVSIVEIDKYMEFISLYSRKDQGLFKYILKKVVEETAKTSGLHIWQEWITNHRLCVIYLNEAHQMLDGNQLSAQSDQVRQWMQDNLKLTVTFGLGSTVTEVKEISLSYESAARALDYKSALGANRVIGHWEIELLSHDDLFVYLQYVRTIAQAFRVGNESWQEQLKLLFDGLRGLLLPKEEISGILTYMNYYFYREMMELPPEYQEVWSRNFRTPWDENLDALETLDELEAFYSANLAACARKMEAIRAGKGNHGVIQQVRSYIEENFSDPDLSLSGLSEQFNMNSSSLSTLFKEEFGEKFVVYLCQVRMEHAKIMLRETSLPIQEIAEKVGYLHQMSFIRAFKKMVGTTPGDYRKVHQ